MLLQTKIFKKEYKVKGEDVDDFMVMETSAYQKYVASIFKTFLFENGLKNKTSKKIDYTPVTSLNSLVLIKPLMFLQEFCINLELICSDKNLKKIEMKSRFFNSNNELCVMANTHFLDFDNAMMNKNKIINVSY
ncbi:hypothetical protein [uncultured Aquimarina sp.]|uniref:hypothetical protein n=1 Tax=uncultured Aquimarina sp. TaxID=575652 RepID=UPI00260A6393|nr:hypothetical protein [uncultured Aquimarina sp.]